MAAEADWSSNFDEIEDTFVYNDFNVGTIVWAQMPGYPQLVLVSFTSYFCY